MHKCEDESGHSCGYWQTATKVSEEMLLSLSMVWCGWNPAWFGTQTKVRIIWMVGRCNYYGQPKCAEESISCHWIFTATASVLAMEPQAGEFVQVLNLHENHCIVVSTIGCKPGCINVYDSLYDTFKQCQESHCRSSAVPRWHHHYSTLCCPMAEWKQWLRPFCYCLCNSSMHWAGSN